MQGIEPTIHARNSDEAMDFGLVLASQGIVHVMERDPETGTWLLRVEESDFARAADNIRKFVDENKGFKWRQTIPSTDVVFHRGAIVWCLVLVWLHGFVSGPGYRLKEIGRMDSELFASGEWWRLFTAVTLHADWSHMVSNATTGLVLFGLSMARFGAGVGLLAAYVAGAAGNWFGLMLYDTPYHSLGASGMVLGALGLLALESLSYWSKGPKPIRRIFGAMAGACMLFLFFGASPESDMAAHLGGFIAGVALGALLSLGPSKERTGRRLNAVCLVVFMAAVYAPWWLAMDAAVSR